MPPKSQPIDERLVVGGIYLILFLRNGTVSNDVEGDFHWGLYYHRSDNHGHKFHIKTISSGWIADHGPSHGFMKSFLLVGLIRIGYCPPQSFDTLSTLVNSFPINQVPPGFPRLNCITWTLYIIHLLITHPSHFVRCHDLGALEREAIKWGKAQHTSASNNVQPRPIVDSACCILT